MGYTKARLEHAMKVFRQRALYRKRKGLKDSYLAQPLNRELRRTTRSSRARVLQNWNFSGAPDDSDEDEYDPIEDRRRLRASRKRKKEGVAKRKLSDAGDEEKVVKKKKGDEMPYQIGDAGYVVLKLTNSKNKSRLEELSRDHRTRPEFSDRNSRVSRRTSGDEEKSSVRQQRGREAAHNSLLGDEAMDLDRDMNTDEDVEIRGRFNDDDLTQTALRSGRVLQRNVENKLNENTIQSNHATLSQNATNQDERQTSPHRSVPLSNNRSTITIGASVADPIEIDSSDEEQSEALVQRNIHPSQASTRSSAVPFHPSNIERFDTSYAHPINFKLFPGRDEASKCHFCSDWTMAVVGLGARNITAARDPQDPTRYLEIAHGRRAEGKTPAQMCVKCSLDRLLIMRCHCPQDQRPLPINTLAHPFSRIYSHNMSKSESYAYLKHLFCRMNGETHLVSPKYQFPACNLCPNPASWRCCKWQARDHARRPCQVPKINPYMQTRANSAVIDLSSSASSPIRETSSPKATSSPTQPRQQLSKPVVISLLDSSDEEDEAPSRNNQLTPRRQVPSPRPTQDPIHLEGSIPTTTTAPLMTTPSNQSLRPPLHGCGLHLCNACHTFVMQSCRGLLPKARILGYLDSTRYKRRADVEWLFKGSLLEEAFERGRK